MIDDNSNDVDLLYSIGIVTYVGRFEKYFIPLIKSLTEIFPDKEIICIINGHHNISLQLKYLKKATSFLKQYHNIRYLTNQQHQSLAKCWNWLMILSSNERVLILNDDLSLSPLFRKDFEDNLKKNPDFFIMNNSWSHF